MDRNIAVVGCGYWGKNLVRNFAQLDALHTICDVDPEKLRHFQPLYPSVNTETHFHCILQNEEIKGVVIATPAVSHCSMAKEALLAGKDVFVEKPLALDVEEGKELVELAENKGRILMVGHLLEYHPAVTKLKEIMDSGKLGKPQYIYSNRLNLGKFRTEENILWSFAPHDISVILLLLNGETPSEVSAHGGYYLHRDVADVTVTTMNFRSGVRAHIFVNWLHPYKEQKLVIVCDRKMAEFNDTCANDKLLLFNHRIERVQGKLIPHPEQAEVVEVPQEEPLKLECQDFLESIKHHKKPKVNGRKGLQVLEILSHCQRSLEENGKVIALSNAENGVFIHETSIVEEPSKIGEGTKIWHFSHIMPGVTMGKGCVVGQNVFVGREVKIGDGVKIENNVSVYEGVTLEDNVFCGPSCVFTNVINPRSHISRRAEFRPTLVQKGATIGANAAIICGNTIGEYAFIGAGAVVTRNIPDYALAYGNPAQIQGWVCECGVKLSKEGGYAMCPECNRIYELDGERCNPSAKKKEQNANSGEN
jgi:UDP-2-acetamido-3-amino-2,3-dideoxy-glucuronate N-acetyltransferase